MLKTVSDRVRLLGGSNVLILGGYVTVTKIYDQYLDQTCYLKSHENEVVYSLIEDLKLSKGNYDKAVREIKFAKKKKPILLSWHALS